MKHDKPQQSRRALFQIAKVCMIKLFNKSQHIMVFLTILLCILLFACWDTWSSARISSDMAAGNRVHYSRDLAYTTRDLALYFLRNIFSILLWISFWLHCCHIKISILFFTKVLGSWFCIIYNPLCMTTI